MFRLKESFVLHAIFFIRDNGVVQLVLSLKKIVDFD